MSHRPRRRSKPKTTRASPPQMKRAPATTPKRRAPTRRPAATRTVTTTVRAAGDGENGGNGDTNTSMPVEGDDQNQDGNTGEDDGQDNPTGTNGEGDNQEGTDNTSNTGDKATTSNTENVETAEEGTEGPDGSDPTENVDYSEVELTSAGQVTMLSDGVLNLIGQDVFDLNDAGYRYFEENDVFDEYLSATSSNSSVVTVEKMDNDTVAYDSFAVVAHKPGKATITLTLKDKAPVSCEVTVDSYSNVDYSKLKFTQKSITMKANQSEWAGDFYYQYISEEGMEAVGHSFVLGSSDYSILDSYASEGSIIAALRPGVVKLGLYFYNPETDEHILTDTATVTVTSAAGSIGNSTGFFIRCGQHYGFERIRQSSRQGQQPLPGCAD